MAHGGRQVIKPQFLHQCADTAFCEASLITAAVGILVKVHVPRVGVAVSRPPGGGGFHSGNVLGRELRLAALAAEPLHQRRHLGILIVYRQRLRIRPPRHTENERPQHGAANDVHAEPITFFKFWQLCDDLFVLQFCGLSDCFCGFSIITKHLCQLLFK